MEIIGFTNPYGCAIGLVNMAHWFEKPSIYAASDHFFNFHHQTQNPENCGDK